VNGTNRPKTAILLFLFLTAAFSSVFYRLLIHAGSLQAHGGRLTFGLMWCPGVAALLTRLILQRNLRGEGWSWGRTKYQFASYWIPLAYASAVYLPLWAAGYASFSAPEPHALASRLGLGSSPAGSILVYFAVLAILGVPSSAVGAMGEELGWRGLLVPELARVTSFPRVAIYSGVIWALWHSPLIIFLDYHGKGGVTFSLVCFVVLVVGVSFLYAWMRLKSGSVWTGVILHASHNIFIQGFFDPLTRESRLTNYAIGEFGFGLAIVAVVLAVVFYRKRGELPAMIPPHSLS
jgi:membrane protease YdiL (CAAX protease family)